jgi:hypothetical protein
MVRSIGMSARFFEIKMLSIPRIDSGDLDPRSPDQKEFDQLMDENKSLVPPIPKPRDADVKAVIVLPVISDRDIALSIVLNGKHFELHTRPRKEIP